MDSHAHLQWIQHHQQALRQRQEKLDDRRVQLVQRCRQIQSTQMMQHAQDELAQVMQQHGYQARLILTAMMNHHHEKETWNQFLHRHHITLQQFIGQFKRQRIPTWPPQFNNLDVKPPSHQAQLNLQHNHVHHWLGQLDDQLTMMEKEQWSDVTESSSGGESCDELDAADTAIVAQRTSFPTDVKQWYFHRGSIASRWTWIEFQKLRLEERLQHYTQMLEKLEDRHPVEAHCPTQLVRPERNTLTVSFKDIENFDSDLAVTIQQEYYRVFPYLCRAVRKCTQEQDKIPQEKEFFISFADFDTRHKVREMTTQKIGSLLKIRGQVVRTHPVHPELINGTFICLECQAVIKDVEQQMKFTQPVVCRNPACQNRSKFMLDVDKSIFVDFQKIRIQETQEELPRGSIPRSMEVILRAEAVEQAQAGDKCDITGTLIVVPDVSQLRTPGTTSEPASKRRTNDGYNNDGVSGLKSLGVRELSYKLSFLACNVTPVDAKFSGRDALGDEMTAERIKKQMTEHEWQKVYEMSSDKNLYQNLITSLFPTIHGTVL
ncbi:uncharacterized protein TRIADDRAFT_62527 [Trichoplax adhaerens]|uniref:DNA replication licensing factor MCM6 n=1 Tax=Trichoplax adhaerens TaxID=10228 RepID=B3SE20_TRIAD|nr:hypothetical protein TRIADDRAFT_62527 [Trichoplax adhaerens]EDV19025.1 hypothetical protein TRIADDRAFT_62527 [Trichoplax adhaerens]|eukprot:XP_002118490.1 hypothetical protein TRIADDRAFT_62527 [Trichoplax adhaerens]